jgi:hypothetical protein
MQVTRLQAVCDQGQAETICKVDGGRRSHGHGWRRGGVPRHYRRRPLESDRSTSGRPPRTEARSRNRVEISVAVFRSISADFCFGVGVERSEESPAGGDLSARQCPNYLRSLMIVRTTMPVSFEEIRGFAGATVSAYSLLQRISYRSCSPTNFGRDQQLS